MMVVEEAEAEEEVIGKKKREEGEVANPGGKIMFLQSNTRELE
jgi:hypothetical protein